MTTAKFGWCLDNKHHECRVFIDHGEFVRHCICECHKPEPKEAAA